MRPKDTQNDEELVDRELRALTSESNLEILKAAAKRYREKGEKLHNAGNKEDCIKIREFECLNLFAAFRMITTQKSPEKKEIDEWIITLNILYYHLRHDETLSHLDLLYRHKLRVFLLSFKMLAMTYSKEYSPTQIMSSFYHFLCEMQSYRNLAIKISKNKNIADLRFIEEALKIFSNMENHKPAATHCCFLIGLHAETMQEYISVREEFADSDITFTAWAIVSFQNNAIEFGDPTTIPLDIEKFPFHSFQLGLLREIGWELASNRKKIKLSTLKNQTVIAKLLFLQLQLEYNIQENEQNRCTSFPNKEQIQRWQFYQDLCHRITPLLYLLNFFTATSDIGFLAFEKFPIWQEHQSQSPEINQTLKTLRHLCLLENKSNFATVLKHLETVEDVDFKKIFFYYLAEKAQDNGVYLQEAASIPCQMVHTAFETLSGLFEKRLEIGHIDLIIKYLGSIIEKTPGWDEFMFILPFFLITKKVLNLNIPQLNLLVKRALEKFQESLVKNRPEENQILEQVGEACELGRLGSLNDLSQIEALELEISKKSDEIPKESASPLQKLELITLYCLEAACTYQTIKITAQKAKLSTPVTKFFSSIEKIEALLQVEAKTSAEEKLLLHRMKVFLLSLKLHIRALTGADKNLVMSDFLHFCCAMQNYKNLAEWINRSTKVVSENLWDLISDATQLFQNAKLNKNRNYWCYHTVFAFVAAIKLIRETDKKNYTAYELGCIKYCFDSLRSPNDFTPKKYIDENHEDFIEKVPSEIIKILLFPQQKRGPAFALESFILLHLFFLRLQLLGLYTEEKDAVRKEALKQNLLSVHQNLKNNLPWLILYHHFMPSPYSGCLSVQSVLDSDETLGLSLSPSEKLKKNPLPFLQKLYESSQTEEEMTGYLQNSKRNKILLQQKKEFSVFAKFFLICQKALLSKNAKLIAEAKDALKVEEAPIEDLAKKLGLTSQAKNTSTSKKTKPAKRKPSTQKAKPIKTESKPPQKEEDSTITAPLPPADTPVFIATSTNVVEKKSAKKKKGKKKSEIERAPVRIVEKILGTEALEICEAQELSDKSEETLPSSETEVSTQFQPPSQISESPEIPEEVQPPASTSSLSLEQYLSGYGRTEISETFLQPKCYPVHELIKLLNSEACLDNNFEFATFLTGGALLYYFLGYPVPIHDYDLRCNAPLMKIEARLYTLKEKNPELGISEISYHGRNSNHPQLFLSFSKYPGLIIEVASMNIDIQVKSFLELIKLVQLMHSDYIVNSAFYTQCTDKEFIIDFQEAIPALTQGPRLLNRTRFEHPPENKVLIILRGLKFLAKYGDFNPSYDLIGWIKENITCFEEVNCFLPSAHAFIKLIYSGYIHNVLVRMNNHNILDLLNILCPVIYRMMQSDQGLYSVLNSAFCIDQNLSLGLKNREARGQYWLVLGEALACFLFPVQNQINLPALPQQINHVREKKLTSWAEFWRPIQRADELAKKTEVPPSLN